MRCANHGALTSSPHLAPLAPRASRTPGGAERRGYRVLLEPRSRIWRVPLYGRRRRLPRACRNAPSPRAQPPYSYLCKSHISVPCPCSTFWYHVTIVKRGCLYSIGKSPWSPNSQLAIRTGTTVPTRPTRPYYTHPLPFCFLHPLPIIHQPSIPSIPSIL